MQTASLHERLARVARSQPRAPTHQPNAELQALIQRVERLRLRARERPRPMGDMGLATSLGGELLCPGLLLIERRYPLWHRHGRVSLQAVTRLAASSPGLVFLDTETTGLAGGTGTIAFMVGLASPSADGVVIRQYLLTGLAAEAEMLATVAAAPQPESALVSFNGKSFDAPLLATRYRLHGMPSPLTRLEHRDALHLLRRHLGRQLPDCRLKTAESILLGFSRRDDLPGSEAPEAWRRLLTEGDASRIGAVLRHNRDDLLSLAALYCVLSDCAGRTRLEPGRPSC